MPKAYFINAHMRTITEFTYDEGTLHTHLPNGIAGAQRYPTGDIMYVSDEGMMHKVTSAFRLKSRGMMAPPLIGDGILAGPDHMKFKGDKHDGSVDDADDYEEITLDPVMGIRDITKDIQWLTVKDALNWYRFHADDACSTMTVNGVTEVLSTYATFLPAMEGEAGGDTE